MSLHIDPAKVQWVLLAGEAHGEEAGWWEVDEASFNIDAYEYVELDGFVLHGGGAGGVCSAGFSFETHTGVRVCGPLTSILAVRCSP